MERKEREQPKRGKRRKRRSFFSLVEERIRHFERLGKKKTAGNYRCAFKHFKRFREESDLAVDELSVGLMRDFQAYLKSEGLKMNTISLYNRELRAVYHYALDEGIIQIDKRPFRKSFTGQEKTRKRAVAVPVIKRLADLSLAGDGALDFARDLFLFSIYMQGMPFVDIAHLKKQQVKNGYVSYRRRKTNRQLMVKIHPKAREIMDKYAVSDPDCPYLFPILYNPVKKRAVEYASALRVYNKRLERISKRLGLDEPLTSYVARHTWASQARRCGVHDTVICEAMGHNNISTTTIYLSSLDTGTVALANYQVIESFGVWGRVARKKQKPGFVPH